MENLIPRWECIGRSGQEIYERMNVFYDPRVRLVAFQSVDDTTYVGIFGAYSTDSEFVGFTVGKIPQDIDYLRQGHAAYWKGRYEAHKTEFAERRFSLRLEEIKQAFVWRA